MDIERLAFETAYSQLRSQKEDLKSFRSQASFCAAISGLIATAFATLADGQFLISRDTTGSSFLGILLSEWLVLVPFLLSVSFAVLAIVHWRECKFDLSPSTALHYSQYYSNYPTSWYSSAEAQLYAQLALDADNYFDANEVVIGWAKTYVFTSLFFALLQVPAWVIFLKSVL